MPDLVVSVALCLIGYLMARSSAYRRVQGRSVDRWMGAIGGCLIVSGLTLLLVSIVLAVARRA